VEAVEHRRKQLRLALVLRMLVVEVEVKERLLLLGVFNFQSR
jgi:hypothetical protein